MLIPGELQSPCKNDTPQEEILIADCGELKEGEPDGVEVDPNADGYEEYPSDDEADVQEVRSSATSR